MPDPKTTERLRGLVLSAQDLKALADWPDALIEDYLNIIDNLITISDLLDIEIDTKIEEILSDFSDGSILFAETNLLVEDNANLFWDSVAKVLNTKGLVVTDTSISRLLSTDGSKIVVSVASDVTGAELETLTDDSMADALHRHSELSASDGTPDACVQVDAIGNVGIGTATPAISAKLEISSTTGALLLSRMTTVQRDALTAVNGMILYNTTLNKIQVYEGGAWASVI